MKSFPALILPAIIILTSCTAVVKKQKSNPDELIYSAKDTSAGPLSAAVNLSGDIARRQLTAQIKLSGSGSAAIDIQEIAIETSAGIRSQPQTGSIIPFRLQPGRDTALTLKFQPLNDLKLYQITGLQGGFKPAYTILLSYKTASDENPATLALESQAENSAYVDYTAKHKKLLTGYSFNTKNHFNENQRKYLSTLKQVNQPPFVYLTEQEIAISGLNFRLKSYYRKDTLHAELFVVNHSDFEVKIIPEALDITAVKNKRSAESKSVSVEKVSGDQRYRTMMEKGDRVLIHFKKYMKIEMPGKDSLDFQIRKAFMLRGEKPLFARDAELLPSQF